MERRLKLLGLYLRKHAEHIESLEQRLRYENGRLEALRDVVWASICVMDRDEREFVQKYITDAVDKPMRIEVSEGSQLTEAEHQATRDAYSKVLQEIQELLKDIPFKTTDDPA